MDHSLLVEPLGTFNTTTGTRVSTAGAWQLQASTLRVVQEGAIKFTARLDTTKAGLLVRQLASFIAGSSVGMCLSWVSKSQANASESCV